MFAASSRRVLPGFTLSLGTSLLFVCLILLLPLLWQKLILRKKFLINGLQVVKS